MIDIHCHIMPGIDDGASNVSASISMAEVAFQSGTKSIIATPHCNTPHGHRNYWSDETNSLLETLRHELKSRHIPVDIYKGQEVFLAGDFMELIRQKKLITLNDSRYILVEFSMKESFTQAIDMLQQLISEGYVPVVAHPERYGFVSEDIDTIRMIKDAGALIQINKGSLKGSFGHNALKVSHKIISKRQADFIASDAHGSSGRNPFLADVYEFICSEFSDNYADFLLRKNPENILKNQEIFKY